MQQILDAAVGALQETAVKELSLMLTDEDALTLAAAAIPHLQLGYEVKQLEWVDNTAKTPFGDYDVYRETDEDMEDFPICASNPDGLIGHFENEADAKSAAQDDFNQCVRECIVGTLTNEGTKPVDVAAVREVEAVIERNGEEVTAAAMISVIADFLRENGKAVLLSENSFGKQILEFKLAADNNRALSAEPAQGEQWRNTRHDALCDRVVGKIRSGEPITDQDASDMLDVIAALRSHLTAAPTSEAGR